MAIPNSHSLDWGVKGPVRVLILTGAQGEPPEDLLAAARDAFQSPLNFQVRVKLHPIRYNPTGRFLGRLREELRHMFHMEHPWWCMIGVPGGGRMPKHWQFIKSRGWQDVSYRILLDWPDVVVYNSTSLWQEVTCPLVHFIQRERYWDYNPAGDQAVSVGDPLTLRYVTYQLGRYRAVLRGLPRWTRPTLKEYGSI